MAKIYLIVGKEFKNCQTLDKLNTQLDLYGLIADPIEDEKNLRDQYTPQNIRRNSDPSGAQRFDYIRLRANDFIKTMIVGKILAKGHSSEGISHQYFPASTTSESIEDAIESLQPHFPDVKIHAVYANAKDIRRV